MANVQANGQRIEYEIRGEGTPVLFVMGLGGQLIDWPVEFLDLFVERGFQTICFDNRDSGLSTMHTWKPAGALKTLWSIIRRKPLRGAGYTLVDMAADTAGLLEALDIEPAVWHVNEGHAAISLLERLAMRMSGGSAFDVAQREVAETSIFTLHTPVPAGIDRFSRQLVEPELVAWAGRLGADVDVYDVENYLLDVDRPLVIPANTRIRYLVTSNDVLHAWWVPDIAIKKDAIPGYVNEGWFEVNEPGVYRGQCAELCGKDHGFMPIVVEARSEDEYKQWVAAYKAEQKTQLAAAQQ